MRFRTEIETKQSSVEITHSDRILLLGSCFTDHIGTQLACDGFEVSANPFGPLFNPASIEKILCEKPSLMVKYGERYHCLDLPSQYQCDYGMLDGLQEKINREYTLFQQFLDKASVAIITLGSAHIYKHINSGAIVTNCHKLPSSEYEFRTLSLTECEIYLQNIIKVLKVKGISTIIFTISPVRHLDRGLEGNFLSKATLRLAIRSVESHDILYFPAFEILIDDLRDYRFYAADMKHPSDVAIEYIYEKFADTFFTRTTNERAKEARKEWLRAQHRPIIK